MTDCYVGEIRPFAGNFAPRDWAFCNGQLIAISQNEVLFTLLGTTYGGDGVNTFALPNLQSRVAMHQGQGQGLSPRTIGEMGGTESVTLIAQQMPQHIHSFNAANTAGTTEAPSGAMLAVSDHSGTMYLDPTKASAPADVTLQPDTITFTGGNQPHNNIMPVCAVSYIISLYGIFPSQN